MKKITALAIIATMVLGIVTINSCQQETPLDIDGPTTTVTDIDSNIYSTVVIGSQTWMKENLKTSHYRDGSAITEIEDHSTWANTSSTTPAWCYYAQSSTNNAIYGKLYNWYAVADPRNICPAGWHIPSDAEWTTLTDFLGGDTIAGGAMKEITLWQSPNTGATNSSGFSGFPGGYRFSFADFYRFGISGCWWSSTSDSVGGGAWLRELFYNDGKVRRWTNNKAGGFSVRCIKD